MWSSNNLYPSLSHPLHQAETIIEIVASKKNSNSKEGLAKLFSCRQGRDWLHQFQIIGNCMNNDENITRGSNAML